MARRLLSIQKAAAYSGLSVYHIRKAIHAGALPVIQIPGTQYPLILEADIDTLLQPRPLVVTEQLCLDDAGNDQAAE